jgi:hypothetical protein
MTYLLDTNVIIDYPELIAGNAIHGISLHEMDNLKFTKPELRVEINRAAKEVMKHMEAGTVKVIDCQPEDLKNKADAVIIEAADTWDMKIMTQDVMMQLLAKASGVEAS